jgi:hypothetical protein
MIRDAIKEIKIMGEFCELFIPKSTSDKRNNKVASQKMLK